MIKTYSQVRNVLNFPYEFEVFSYPYLENSHAVEVFLEGVVTAQLMIKLSMIIQFASVLFSKSDIILSIFFQKWVMLSI